MLRDRKKIFWIFCGICALMFVMNGLRGDMGGRLISEILMIPGMLIGISFHEFAHGWVAYKLGDPTPKFQGRLTVNPKAHVDPIGFIALLFIGFGWGRAVEINPYNFKNRRRDEMMVAFAGVTMNLFLAIVFSFIYKILASTIGVTLGMGGITGYLGLIIFYIVNINVVLMIFNLLPVPPLDGFNIATQLFKLDRKPWYYTLYNNGFFILMILILFNVTDLVLRPLISVIMNLMTNIMF